MKSPTPYFAEHAFLILVYGLTLAGFWHLYVGGEARPNAHHHLHVATVVAWLVLLSCQLWMAGRARLQQHRRIGLAVFVAGPLLVATTALLSVHSAYKGLVSGQGDFLIVQNVMGTLELAFLIVAAFVVKKRRVLHGSFLLSTGILFMGIALFFALIGFVPAFRIDGPETFYRFQTAAMTGQVVCLVVGVLFVIKDFRNGWPMLLAAVFIPFNELIRVVLSRQGWIAPLTEAVGTMSQTATFLGTFVVVFALIAATGTGRTAVSGRPRAD
ncbi:hypothetical protein [Arenimonas sp. MALMAid1274]|uniref:hypothetical protein n=1 Tax=Arenimonas sp. MALMAid1274 TaxID=3411630 RepID=UPI003B9EB454